MQKGVLSLQPQPKLPPLYAKLYTYLCLDHVVPAMTEHLDIVENVDF